MSDPRTVNQKITETEAQRVKRMALDPNYPSDFEWGKLLFLLGGMDYEARTIENAKMIIEWFRARKTGGRGVTP